MIYSPLKIIEKIKATNGALSVCESLAIMQLASTSPAGKYIELGVFHGKSAMSAAFYLPKGTFILVDPIFIDEKDVQIVVNNMWETNDKHTYCIAPNLSFEELQKHTGFSYAMVDSGSHGDGLPMREVKLLEDKMVKDGVIVFHDYNSQFREVKEAYDYLVSTGKYQEISINWSEIIDYVMQNKLEQGNQSWHHNELEYPCFLGALKKI